MWLLPLVDAKHRRTGTVTAIIQLIRHTINQQTVTSESEIKLCHVTTAGWRCELHPQEVRTQTNATVHSTCQPCDAWQARSVTWALQGMAEAAAAGHLAIQQVQQRIETTILQLVHQHLDDALYYRTPLSPGAQWVGRGLPRASPRRALRMRLRTG